MMDLEAPKFFRLAERVFAFPGVLQARLAAEQSQGKTTATAQPRSPGASHPAAQRVNLAKQGASVATTTLSSPSYLHDLLKGQP